MAIVVAMACLVSPARAQPLADRVPQDALLYVGWAGAAHLPGGYAGSHLDGLIKETDAARVLSDSVPRAFAVLRRQFGGNGHFGEALRALAGPMWRHPSAVYWGGVDILGDVPLPKMALVVDAGDEGKGLAERLRVLMQGAPPQILVRVEEEGGLVVFAMGPVEVSARKKPVIPLGRRKEFRAAMDGLVKEPALAVYADAEGLTDQIDTLLNAFAPADAKERWGVIKEAFGIAGFKRVAWAGGFEDKLWVTAAFVAAPEPRAAANKVLFDAKPLSAEILAAIPKTSTMAWAGHLDLGLAFSEGRKITKKLDEFAGQDFETRLEIWREAAGFDLQTDLADALGDEWAAYTDPATGGAGVLGAVIVNRLHDPAKAERSLGKLEEQFNKLMGERSSPRVAMRTVRAGEMAVHYLAVPGAAPAWAVRDGYLFVGLYPQSVIAAARHVAAKGKSLAENADYVALTKRLGQASPTSVHFMDLPRLARSGYADLLMLGRSVLGPLDLLGADSPALAAPTLETLMAHVTPAGGVCWADAAGWHMRSASPFPGSGVLALSGMGPVVAGGEAALAWATVRPIARASSGADRRRSADNLRMIGLVCRAYANANQGKLPTNLGELVMLADFDLRPETFLVPGGHAAAPPAGDKEQLAAWVTRSSDYVYLGSGKRADNDVSAVIAHEPLDPDRGMVATLFADGHVEVLSAARVRELVQRAGAP